MDYFNEYLVPRKKDGKDIAIIVGVILLGIVLSVVLAVFLLVPMIGQIVLLAIAGVWYGVYVIISRRRVEFEYIVTNGDMDVDKIVAKRKRTRMFSLNAKDIEVMAPLDDPAYTRDRENVNIVQRLDISSGNAEVRRYFAVFVKDAKRTMIIFEPTRRMLAIFKRYRPQNIHLAPEDAEEV